MTDTRTEAQKARERAKFKEIYEQLPPDQQRVMLRVGKVLLEEQELRAKKDE